VSDRDQTRVDMHIKTLNSRVVARAKQRGIDILVYAPHFVRLPEITARAQRFSDDELLVVPAREIFTGDWRNRRHILSIGLSDPVPDFITLEAALAELDRQGAAVLAPHPEFMNVSLEKPEITAHSARIDAVETYNAKLFPHQNKRGQRIAAEIGDAGFGSSYAHLSTSVGEAWTSIDERIPSDDALVAALKNDVTRRAVHRTGPRHHLQGAIEFAHLGYENTWQKLDRLLLSGTEPTHPRNLLYDGRFDDVSVY